MIHLEAAFNMEKRARELLEVKPINRDLLMRTETATAEDTGSVLIAEFKKLLHQPYKPLWVITSIVAESGEKFFKVMPYKHGRPGLWFFKDYLDAKLNYLKADMLKWYTGIGIFQSIAFAGIVVALVKALR